MAQLKLATYNVNGIKSRLDKLLEWLERESPDIACLQELKAESHGFPMLDIRARGYEAIWHGQRSWNGVAILAKTKPHEIGRAMPGDPADEQSRYIEADVGDIRIGCIYLPNGNPQPGPKFGYKLAWFERLIAHAATLLASKLPVVLAGDYNVVPTEADIYPTRSYAKDALVQPQSRAAFRRILDQGWLDAIRALHPDTPQFSYWSYLRKRWPRRSELGRP